MGMGMRMGMCERELGKSIERLFGVLIMKEG